MPRHTALTNKFLILKKFFTLFAGLVAVLLLLQPLSIKATEPLQGETLLYTLLGLLEFRADRFQVVDDPSMRQQLQGLVQQYQLSSGHAAAYVGDAVSGELLWSTVSNPPRLDAWAAPHGYALQELDAGTHTAWVQPFWLEHGGVRREFRMVLVLPKWPVGQ